jgi:hypothetical protein
MKAKVPIGLVCAVALSFAVLIAYPARAQNDTTQSLLLSILQQLVLIEQHTRPPCPLTQ